MDSLPREQLREIVSQYGPSLCYDRRRCEGLLRDRCGACRAEIDILVAAVREGLAGDLLVSSGSEPREASIRRLTRRLESFYYTEAAARWSIESWALALGLVEPGELTAVSPAAPTSAATPASQVTAVDAAAATPVAPDPAGRVGSRRPVRARLQAALTAALFMVLAVVAWVAYRTNVLLKETRAAKAVAEQDARSARREREKAELEAARQMEGERAGRKAAEDKLAETQKLIPKGAVEAVTVKGNSYNYGRYGELIQVKFKASNLQSVQCVAIAYFYDEAGNALKDYNGMYRSVDGQVSSSASFTPASDGETSNSIDIFIPDEELHMAAGEYKLKLKVQVKKSVGGTLLAESGYAEFPFVQR